ncbi:MAG: coproporphyrinogen III oxidase [Myxococcota bacterium]
MTRTPPRSEAAARALTLVESLQRRFVTALEDTSAGQGAALRFTEVEWLRDEGRHGGGTRFEVGDTPVFNRASVNVSQVHYDDDPNKRLASATALSTIVHPRHPHAPSVHIHISWTQMRSGKAYWRMMADLNPSIPHEPATRAYEAALEAAAPEQHADAMAAGDRYFHIPALKRHRGVYHFYLEGYVTEDAAADEALANTIGTAAIDTYVEVLTAALRSATEPAEADIQAQLHYHTLYLFQVLTLDRGTTSGLLVHDQNDVGILGSLPSHVDRDLLASWRDRLQSPQDGLLDALVAALGSRSPAPVDLDTKRALARVVREHYRAHPEALSMQASGTVIPPTVANHR